MRNKIILLGLLIVLCSSFVAAGESYDVSFSGARTQPVWLYEGDEVRFHLVDDDHVIIMHDVGASSVKVLIGPQLSNNTELFMGLIGLDYVMALDFDKDGTTDMNVALYSISEDQEVQLVLQDVTGTTDEVTGDVGLVDSGEGNNKRTILIVLGVLILGLVAFLVFRNKEGKADVVVEEKPETAPSSPEPPSSP